MSAPLVVNTKDGVCWTRRTVTSGGIALYAPETVKTCPGFVMATLTELAEHGIVGSAFALPVPVAPEPQPRTMLDRARDALNARMTKDALRLVLENVIGYAAALETERHSTNEALSEAAEALRANRDRIAELEENLRAVNAGWDVSRARIVELEARLAEQAAPVHSSHTSWQLEVLDGGTVWVGTGMRAADREAAEDLLTRERNARPDVQFRLVRATTTYALEPAAEEPGMRHAVRTEDAEEDCDHPNGYGPHGCAGCGAATPADDEDDVTPQVTKLRNLLAGQRQQTGGAS